jgi:hypothetical protein
MTRRSEDESSPDEEERTVDRGAKNIVQAEKYLQKNMTADVKYLILPPCGE